MTGTVVQACQGAGVNRVDVERQGCVVVGGQSRPFGCGALGVEVEDGDGVVGEFGQGGGEVDGGGGFGGSTFEVGDGDGGHSVAFR